MRRQQDAVAKLAQRRLRRQRLLFEGIDGGAANAPGFDRLCQCFLVDHLAAGGVDHDRIGLHQRELTFAEHVTGLLGEHDMERNHVGFAQQRGVVHRLDAVGEEMRRRHIGIVGDDARAPRRQKLRDPGADTSEADDADRLARKSVR